MPVVVEIILYLVIGKHTKLPLNVWPVQDRIGHGPVVVRPRVILHHLYKRDHLPFRFYFKQASHLKIRVQCDFAFLVIRHNYPQLI
jgi:hypothetical protein